MAPPKVRTRLGFREGLLREFERVAREDRVSLSSLSPSARSSLRAAHLTPLGFGWQTSGGGEGGGHLGRPHHPRGHPPRRRHVPHAAARVAGRQHAAAARRGGEVRGINTRRGIIFLRLVGSTWRFRAGDRSRGRFATPPNCPLHDCSPYSHVHERRESLRFDHRSRTVFCRPVPNLGVTIRFCIAVRGLSAPSAPSAPLANGSFDPPPWELAVSSRSWQGALTCPAWRRVWLQRGERRRRASGQKQHAVGDGLGGRG
jgi:hypothetical protein